MVTSLWGSSASRVRIHSCTSSLPVSPQGLAAAIMDSHSLISTCLQNCSVWDNLCLSFLRHVVPREMHSSSCNWGVRYVSRMDQSLGKSAVLWMAIVELPFTYDICLCIQCTKFQSSVSTEGNIQRDRYFHKAFFLLFFFPSPEFLLKILSFQSTHRLIQDFETHFEAKMTCI